jgi:hypothetical protein
MWKNAAISLVTCLALGRPVPAARFAPGSTGVLRATPTQQIATSVTVKRVPRESVPGLSLLRNGDLEQVAGQGGEARSAARFAGTEAWELGYEVDAGVAHGGRHSARCAAGNETEQRGILFVARLNQQRPTPIRAECWSKARDITGNPDGGYSLYLDITYNDGTPLWGQLRPFSTGTHDWEKAVVTVVPGKPIREVRIHGLLRGHRGAAWFDDFALWELRPKGKWSVFDGMLVEEVAHAPASMARVSGSAHRRGARRTGLVRVTGGGASLGIEAQTGQIVNDGRAGGFLLRDVGADSDFRRPLGRATWTRNGVHFRGEDAELGLALEAEYEGRPDHVRVRGTVEDLTGRDRAVTVYFALPVDARGWRWAANLRGDETIAPDGDYQATVQVAGGAGRMSRWPMAAVYPARPRTVRESGWAIGYPLDLPRINRVGYNAASRELYAAVDLGLSADTARFPRRASFEFVLYRFDPGWGMRAALKRYYEIFPDDFAKRVKREGIWMPFTDIASVKGWQDFGFAFHEGTNNVPFDAANGIYSFEYVEPVSYWMAMPKDMPRTREAAEALLREKARAAPDMSYAAATYTSIIHDANGAPVEMLLKAPWCDGALFIVNPAPSVPVTAEYPVNKAQVMFHDIDAAIAGHRWPLREWTPWDRGFVIEPGAGPNGATALRCENAAGESSGASQTVILDRPLEEPLVARAWSKAERVTGGQDVDYSIYLDLLYADGTPGFAFVAPFRTGTHDWEMAEVRITPPKPVAQVHFHLLLRAPHTGRAWFTKPELTIWDHGNWLANPGFVPAARPAPAVSGTYIDSLEMGSEFLNYRREHWRDARIPLVFDRASGRCAQALIFGTYEFVWECAERTRQQGQLMFANGALWRYIQFAALLDVMGTETNWLVDGQLRPESDDVMMIRRALCYQKPYCLLMNSDYNKFPREYTERYFRRCLFYAIFPSFFSHNAADNPYWATPALYNRDRGLFKRYMPVIQKIAWAGWEPVTYSRSDNAQVYVERYGPRDGVAYLTVMNASDKPKRARVTADLAALQMAGWRATEVMSGREVVLQPQGGGVLSFTARLEPEEVWVVRLTSRAKDRIRP